MPFFIIVSRTLTMMRSISLTIFKLSAYMIVDRRTKCGTCYGHWLGTCPYPFTQSLWAAVLFHESTSLNILYHMIRVMPVLRLCDGVFLFSRIYWRSVCAAVHTLFNILLSQNNNSVYAPVTLYQSLHCRWGWGYFHRRECHCHVPKIRDFRIKDGKNWCYSKMFLVS